MNDLSTIPRDIEARVTHRSRKFGTPKCCWGGTVRTALERIGPARMHTDPQIATIGTILASTYSSSPLAQSGLLQKRDWNTKRNITKTGVP